MFILPVTFLILKQQPKWFTVMTPHSSLVFHLCKIKKKFSINTILKFSEKSGFSPHLLIVVSGIPKVLILMTNLDEVQVSCQEVIFFSSSFESYSSQVSPYLFTLTKENKRKNRSSHVIV